MASVIWRASASGKGGSWYVKWKDARGKWRRKATTARTKREAVRLAEDLGRQAERQRMGLEPTDLNPEGWLLRDLLGWWLETYVARTASFAQTESQVRCHLLDCELAELPIEQVTTASIEARLQLLAGRLSAQTLNHLRQHLRRAFAAAEREGRWHGPNPADRVVRRRVASRPAEFLRPEEAQALLGALETRWRPFFATALYLGLRKGELCALRREDVDLEGRWLTVRRSWERDTTKGGHGDHLPIPKRLVPYLRTALAHSPSDLVFPRPDGKQHVRTSFKPEGILRRAMVRAGLVVGWVHKCRRKGCGYRVPAQDAEIRRCPECNYKLWPSAVQRRTRFHDLRHSTASLLLAEGVPLEVVARILRHGDPRLTRQVYGHLTDEYLRAAVDGLDLDPKDQNEVSFGPYEVHDEKRPPDEGRPNLKNIKNSS